MRLLGFIRRIFRREPRGLLDFGSHEDRAVTFPSNLTSWPAPAVGIAKITYPESWTDPSETPPDLVAPSAPAPTSLAPPPYAPSSSEPAPAGLPDGTTSPPAAEKSHPAIKLPADARVLLGFGDGSLMALKEGHPLTRQFVRAADRLTGKKWLQGSSGTNDSLRQAGGL